jgi:hypothetical protein
MSNVGAVEKDVVAAAYEAEAELASRMSRREMRKAGLTVLNVRQTTRQLARNGDITSDMPQERIRDIVLDQLYIDNPKGFENLGAPDWDAIIAFITKLLPLILQILAIFGL